MASIQMEEGNVLDALNVVPNLIAMNVILMDMKIIILIRHHYHINFLNVSKIFLFVYHATLT